MKREKVFTYIQIILFCNLWTWSSKQQGSLCFTLSCIYYCIYFQLTCVIEILTRPNWRAKCRMTHVARIFQSASHLKKIHTLNKNKPKNLQKLFTGSSKRFYSFRKEKKKWCLKKLVWLFVVLCKHELLKYLQKSLILSLLN